MILDKVPDINLFIRAIQNRKAKDLVILDVGGLTTIADVFIICSGKSSRQVVAIADHVQSELEIRALNPCM